MTSITPSTPSTIDELADALRVSGRVSAHATLTSLAGGVSSIVAIVQDGADRWVAKTPLSRLAVGDEWIVDRRRGRSEALILEFLDGDKGSFRTPRLRFFDDERIILGQEMIEGPPPTYKEDLLAGRLKFEVAAALGSGLSELQRLDIPTPLKGDDLRELFDSLRLEPYYRATAARVPEVSDAIFELIEETQATSKRTLVHGDFTPKNVLVVDGGPVLVDWEVCHAGDPAFDLGTMTAHFTLKALRHCDFGRGAQVLEALHHFWNSYDGEADQTRAFRHAAAIVLARRYGKSPVEYLTGEVAQRRVVALGMRGMRNRVNDVEQWVALVDRVASEVE